MKTKILKSKSVLFTIITIEITTKNSALLYYSTARVQKNCSFSNGWIVLTIVCQGCENGLSLIPFWGIWCEIDTFWLYLREGLFLSGRRNNRTSQNIAYGFLVFGIDLARPRSSAVAKSDSSASMRPDTWFSRVSFSAAVKLLS